MNLNKYVYIIFFLVMGQLDATYYSQVGQDKFVQEKFFQDKKEGVFVDIGAYDGVTGSNTYFFEKERGWTGVCVEPQPNMFVKLKEARKCICIQGAVSDTAKKAQFLHIPDYADQLSGLVDEYHPEHAAKIKYCEERFGVPSTIIEVDCFPFNDLMAQNGITHIDFLSIDTEGNEYTILKSIDWNKVKIDVIALEDNYHDPRFAELLQQQGYECVARLCQDCIFARKDLAKVSS